ncbi:MAG TPA: protein kinase [Candidatus Krumholzibacteria bacterium]|nr:protein kinase [Candidatus Krumholzibacteria bacterium]
MQGRRFGGYELGDKLGEGGMGAVFLARDSTLDRSAAIKIIRAESLTTEGKERFLREARACSRINHPNIITVYAAGDENGTPYMAMEYIDGRTLRDIMHDGPVAWRKATKWLVNLLDALQRLHGVGIVHRDLKPENIMVTRDGIIKLMDFGLAHLTTQTAITQEGTTLGTAPYMSPEQVMGRRLDARSDLFSLITIYDEMLTGRYPFSGDHAMSIMYAIRNEPPAPLTCREPDFPPALKPVVARAFEKEPDKRYPDAAALRAAVLEAAPEIGSGVRIVHASTRRTTVMAAMVALVVLALGVTGWSVVQKRHAAADRNAARNLNELGMAKQDAGDAAGAEAYYRQAVEKDKRYARPYNNLGLLALRSGQTAEADSMFRLAVSLDSRYSAALVNLGDLYVDAKPESAEVFYARALKGDDPAPAANQLGNLMLTHGRAGEARSTLSAALPQATRDDVRGALLRNLGKAEAAQGDSASARSHWREAAQLLPNDAELHSLLSH